jgi:putative phosphoesterase
VRVAALYDVHGNLPALEAVLAEVEREGVDAIVCGGDVCAGPMPRECLDALAGAVFVRGNADRELAGWAAEQLDDAQVTFLRDLPLTAVLDVDGLGPTCFCHATPRSDEEILTRISPDERWEEALAGVDADVVVCGHTHMQFERAVGGVRLLNAGSVGMPYEAEPGAYWALLGPDVELRRTNYDVEAAIAQMQATDDPRVELIVEMMRTPPAQDEVIEDAERRVCAG